MSIIDGIFTAIFCMFVVFIVLACLYVLIKLFSFEIRKIESLSRKAEQ
jgi:Na+-transporting methylmalonyl-CoA/oxaloacetate decarboxylase gamma subunit